MTRSYDLARQLTERGHEVTIFAAGFSHYRFAELRLARHESSRVESFDGVRFVWVRTWPYRGNDYRRVLNMLTFAWGAFWTGLRMPERPDVVTGNCNHLFAVFAAWLLATAKRSRFFFEVADLWPQTLIDLGRLARNHPAAVALRTLERFLYARADAIIQVAPFMRDYIETLGIDGRKIVSIPNGVDLSRDASLEPYDGGGRAPFVLMHLGGLVNATSVDTLLRAMRILQDEGVDAVRAVMVGGGQEKPNLMAMARDLGLSNVEFRDPVARRDLAAVKSQADGFYWGMRDVPLYKYGVSANKAFEYLAAGRPIVLSGAPRNNCVAESGAGFTVAPEDAEALAEAIKRLIALSPEDRREMGRRGQEYVREHHDMRVLGARLEKLLLAGPPLDG